MAVITSAIVAVSAAALSVGAVSAGIATVATIGAVVGGIGLAVGVVGMVTKNKDLMKVGSIMGALGAGAGLGAGIAPMAGLGTSAASTATSGGQAATELTKTGSATSVQGMAQVGDAAAKSIQTGSSLIDPSVGNTVTAGLQSSGPMLQGVGAGTVLAPPAAPPMGLEAVTSTTNHAIANAGAYAPQAPVTPWVGTVAPTVASVTPPPPPPAPTIGMGDYTKGMIGLGGMQMAGSTVGGLFQGQAVYKAAEQQEKENLRRFQAEEEQRKLINANNAYAPRVSYGSGTGMIRRAS